MLRRARSEDAEDLYTMLRSENVQPKDMCVFSGETWVQEINGHVDGFFTFRIADGLPYVAHFCVARSVRSPEKAREIAWAMVEKLRELGFEIFTTSVDKNNERLQKVVRYFFRCRPYDEKDGQIYFISEVPNGKKLSTAAAAANR